MTGFRVIALATLVVAGGCAPVAEESGDTEASADSGEIGWVGTEDGSRMRYRILGAGETAVVVPMDVFLADALAPLADGRRLILYDPVGRGASDAADPATLSGDRMLRDLEALRAALGLEEMALVGWSGLGLLVARYAIEHPGRVTRVALISPVGPTSGEYALPPGVPSREERLDAGALADLDARKQAGEFDGDLATHCRAENRILLPTSFVDPALAAEVPDVCVHENEWPDTLYPYFGRLLGSFAEFDHRAGFRALDIPKLVIHGREDGIPLSGGRAWVAGDPLGRIVELSPSGHFPFIEQREATLSALETFFGGAWPAEAEPVEDGLSRKPVTPGS